MQVAREILRLALGTRPPRTEGAITVRGLRAHVEVRRDDHGVPYIDAVGDDDVWFGLGFCHGQDRAGQLEIIVRSVRGTLAEVAGEEALGIDRLARRIGFRTVALGQVRTADPAVRRQFEAYAAGVNEGLARGARRSAHELTLLRSRPTEWDAADVQAVTTFLCFALTANWDSELVRLKILEEDGRDALLALDPRYPDWLPVTHPARTPAGNGVDRLAEDVQALSDLITPGLGGSNAWAVSGKKTRTGRPILAGDPHLMPVAPVGWYLARLRTPRWKAVGATFSGVPAIVTGHNGFAAWGVTAAHVDNTDFFLEEIGPDGKSVREGDAFVPCQVRREEIKVKGRKEPVVEEVLVTRRGPVVGPAFDGQRKGLSLCATWLRPEPYKGLFAMHKVKSPADARRAFDQNSAAATCLVYADIEGNISWQLSASTPRRKKGFGTIPQPGWDPEAGWEAENVPWDALPYCENPAEGFVATANNQPVVDSGGPFLGIDFLDGYRQARLCEALAARSDWDVDSTLALQTDVVSLPWREIQRSVLATPGRTAASRRALSILAAWDGQVREDSVGASVFELFVAAMCRRVVEAKAPKAAAWALGRGFSTLLPHNLLVTRRLSHLCRLLREQPSGFLPRPWDEEIDDALAAAVRTLEERAGVDTADWRWGEVRPLRLLHPFGDRRPLDRVFNAGPYPGRGDASTVCQGAVSLLDPLDNPVGVPTVRVVIDVGDWDRSRFVLLGGQSGNPLLPQYEDQVPLWQRGQGIPIPFSDDEAARRAGRALTLIPAAN